MPRVPHMSKWRLPRRSRQVVRFASLLTNSLSAGFLRNMSGLRKLHLKKLLLFTAELRHISATTSVLLAP
jgi:hypothetical protein